MVELAGILEKETGTGVGRRRLTAGLARLRDVHATLRRGAENFRWPHLLLPDDASLDAVIRVAGEMRARVGQSHAQRLVVAGQPGGVETVRMVVDALTPGSPITWVESEDAADLPGLEDDGVTWLVLEGPRWADALAEKRVEEGRGVAVAGEGVHEAPPGGWWISDPVAGDGRFGALGMASLVCAAWAGVDVRSLVAGAREMEEACARPALFENPAYSLALATEAVERHLGLVVATHLVPTPRLRGFAAWVARLGGAVLSGHQSRDGIRVHRGAGELGGVLGDEEMLEVLLSGTRDKFPILWDVDGIETPGRAFTRIWAREGLPTLRVRLPDLEAAALGGAILLASHAAVTGALFRDLDPLALESVRAWYEALERDARERDEGAGAPADIDGGAHTA